MNMLLKNVLEQEQVLIKLQRNVNDMQPQGI